MSVGLIYTQRSKGRAVSVRQINQRDKHLILILSVIPDEGVIHYEFCLESVNGARFNE